MLEDISKLKYKLKNLRINLKINGLYKPLMCESFDNIPIIRVGEKTNKAKYDFLRLYYTLWNVITKTRPRIIIDTHAGSGIVELHGEKDYI